MERLLISKTSQQASCLQVLISLYNTWLCLSCSPGQSVTSPASSRLSLSSLSELSSTKIWNFFTDPNTSTRNLLLNIGFAVGGHILWILPTFLGILPDSRSEERVGGLPANLAGADPVALWNRLLCPQCILQIVGINSITVSNSNIIIISGYVLFISSILGSYSSGPSCPLSQMPQQAL